ncbi:hypothetical protein JYK14_25160 [Siccirubricoccus sp. KC 17139]|uniref:Glycine zipper 2TM domain-containing protein n=1 Tax=Siccirubricoccus soli TaxID=2899147 RepID=A0ABT1DBV5_9PROT|nr:hypothetical protein [Siccirubricoccus soli]MCO6419426.1 hypothetical protein [Siccirubricoccus soli]MCP2685561.1 hypothetical protein [Siccirubricoccus soli]
MRYARLIAVLALLAGCTSDYSPDTYATRAVQQANKVEQGTVVGRREVQVSAEGSTGAATGAAAGGALGAQTPGGGIASALGGVGGALIGGLVGTAAEHAAVDIKAFEYVVRTGKGELVSVTQRDRTPLVVGQRVLVITGNQARIVPDYISDPAANPPAAAAAAPPPAQPAAPPAAVATPSAVVSLPAIVPPPPVVVPPPPPPPVAEAPAPTATPATAETSPEAPATGSSGASSALQGAAEDAALSRLPPIAQPVARSLSQEVTR